METDRVGNFARFHRSKTTVVVGSGKFYPPLKMGIRVEKQTDWKIPLSSTFFHSNSISTQLKNLNLTGLVLNLRSTSFIQLNHNYSIHSLLSNLNPILIFSTPIPLMFPNNDQRFIHTQTHSHTQTRTHTKTQTYTHLHLHKTCTHAHTQTHTYTYIHIHTIKTHTHTHTRTHKHAYTHAHTHAYTHANTQNTHTHKHTNTHTHTH